MYTTELVRFEPGQRREEEKEEESDSSQQEPQTYREAVKKYYLRFHDLDLVSVLLGSSLLCLVYKLADKLQGRCTYFLEP